MNAKRFAVLFVCALATIAFALWLSTQRDLPRDADFGARALDGLEPELDAIERVRIVGAGERTLVTLVRRDGRWRVAERDYPADAPKVKRLLLALAELRTLEPKTSEPANYARLGVEDVRDAAASGVRVELGGAPRAFALIVGRPGESSQSTYVRPAAGAQALEVRPALDVERDPRQWLARTVLDVGVPRVQSLEVARADGPARSAAKSARTEAGFEVGGPGPKNAHAGPGGAAPGGVAASVAAALAMLECEDVAPALTVVADGPPHVARFRTFDGLVVTVRGYASGERRWMGVEASFDAAQAARFPPAAGEAAPAPGTEQVSAEAQRLAATSRDVRYLVPAWKFDAIFRPAADALGTR